jgi:hypothetical protein
MTRRDSPSGRRHFRLGPLTLVAEPNISAELIESLIPRTNPPAEDTPAAAAWLSHSSRPLVPGGPPSAIADGVAVWVDESAERATVLGATGHATVDLRDRWARIDPGSDPRDAVTLFDATVALILGRASVVLLNASAVIDIAGGGWLITGDSKARTALVRAFVADGCEFVSDGVVLVRHSHHQAHAMIVESWHRGDAPVSLAGERWRPIAQTRGTIIAQHHGAMSGVANCQGATRADVAAALVNAAPLVDADEATREMLTGVVTANAALPGVRASLNIADAPESVKPIRALSNALEAMIR